MQVTLAENINESLQKCSMIHIAFLTVLLIPDLLLSMQKHNHKHNASKLNYKHNHSVSFNKKKNFV